MAALEGEDLCSEARTDAELVSRRGRGRGCGVLGTISTSASSSLIKIPVIKLQTLQFMTIAAIADSGDNIVASSYLCEPFFRCDPRRPRY